MADIYADLDKIVELANRIAREVDDAIEDAAVDNDRCDRTHCDDWDCTCEQDNQTEISDIQEIVADYLRQIRMGYTLDVTLRDVLEEMERSTDSWL